MNDTEIVLIIIVSVAIMVALSLGVILFFHLSQRKIQQERLKAETLKTQFQKELLQQNIQTQEKERARIARELHDDIGSKLNIIHLNLHLIQQESRKGKPIDELLGDIQQALKSSIDSSRQISHDLLPPTLRKFGLQAAIEDLQNLVNQSPKPKLTVKGAALCDGLSDQAQLHLFRIVQELVQNALKHAEADNLYLNFSEEDKLLRLSYEDDGVGLPDNLDISSGLGMSNLKSRVQMLDGDWLIERGRATGTLINIAFPK
jgi:signal transduction histidine kinase